MTYWKRLLAKDDTPEGQQKARWLIRTLLVFGIGTVALLMSLAISDLPAQEIRSLALIDIAALAVVGVLLLLLRQRRINAAAWLLLTVFFLLIVYPPAFLFGSINAPNMYGIFVLIPLSGLLLGGAY